MTKTDRPVRRRCRWPSLAATVLAIVTAWAACGADVNDVAVSPDGTLVAVAAGELAVRETASLAVRWLSVEKTNECRAVAFSPDGAQILSGHRNGTLLFWRTADGELLRTLTTHKRSVNAVAFSGDGRLVASASSDRTVAVCDAGTGARVLALEGHARTVNGVAFAPDGQMLASAASDGTVRLWNASSGEELRALEGHESSVWGVAWSPDGRWLASASWDMTVRIWDTATGVQARVLEGNTSYVRDVAFSPDGVHVASASWDRSVRCWDLRSGQEAAVYRGHSQPVRCLAYLPDGRALVSGAAFECESVRVWRDDVPFVPDGAPAELTVPEAGTELLPPAPPPVELLPGHSAWRDGTHADETHAAIQAALAAAATRAERGPPVVLPPGVYIISKPLAFAHATLRGPGAVLTARNMTQAYYFGLSLGSSARLEDIHIVGEGPKCVPVRFSNPARDVRLRDVHITGGTILVNGQARVEDVSLEGCLFEGGSYGLLLDQPSSGRNVRVTNCVFRGNGSDAIELNFPRHRKGRFVEDIIIANCVFEDTGHDPNNKSAGFSIGMAGARGVQITGNTFRRASVQAVHIEDCSEDITITGNNFLNCGIDHTGGNWTGGVHILSGSRYITVAGNNFGNCRFGVSGLQYGRLQWCTITGNTFRNCEFGVRILQFPHGVIQGNAFEDCQTAISIWRTPLWNISGNVIRTAHAHGIGIACSQYQNVLISGNTIQAPTPVDHRDTEGDSGPSFVEGNLLLREPATEWEKRGRSSENE